MNKKKKSPNLPPLKVGLIRPASVSSLFNECLHIFHASKFFKSDFNIAYENPEVQLDVFEKTLQIKVNRYKDQTISKQIKKLFIDPDTPRVEDVRDSLTIRWEEISGLEFQYSPCEDAIVCIELYNYKAHVNPNLSSNFYFLQLSKTNSSKYFDDILLKADDRLRKLSIKQLPSWSTAVNRYRIPIPYSYRIRMIITIIVNIYILISLIWGFYDLYKHLPFVGNFIKNLLNPLMDNLFKRFVLIPLFINRFASLFSFLFNNVYISYLWALFISCYELPFIQTIISLPYLIYSTIIQPILFIQKSIYNLIIYPFFILPYQSIKWICDGQLEAIKIAISFLYNSFKILYSTLLYPCMKVREHSGTIKTTIDHSRDLKGYLTDIQITISPFQSVWNGIRRIIDFFYHIYLVKIKYQPFWKKWMMILGISFVILLGLFIIIYLII